MTDVIHLSPAQVHSWRLPLAQEIITAMESKDDKALQGTLTKYRVDIAARNFCSLPYERNSPEASRITQAWDAVKTDLPSSMQDFFWKFVGPVAHPLDAAFMDGCIRAADEKNRPWIQYTQAPISVPVVMAKGRYQELRAA